MLIDETKDAQVDSSATESTETQTDQVQSADSSQATQDQASSSQQQDANQSAAPNQPPYQNLVAEAVRKSQESIGPLIQGAIREAMLGYQPGQGQNQQAQKSELKYQGKYTVAELENILRHPEASESDKHFANRGLAYIEVRQDSLKDLDSRQEKSVNESRQTQALQSIVKDYPQVFNAQSNQWNFVDPLWQNTMKIYNSNPRLQSFGNEGLRVAMDSAYAQMAREGQINLKKKEVQINSKQKLIEKNQSQALNGGTLTPTKQTGPDTSKAKVMEAWKKNPGSEDAKRAALANLIPKSWLT